MERLRRPGRPAGTLFNIEGGPGGSASARSQRSARLFAPLLDRYQLVLVDARGTGLSRPLLRCPSDPAACARRLGRQAGFYTTADNVADLEAVRRALGAPKVFLYGTSYGTFAATQYARTHPGHTERIAVDSPVPSTGVDALNRETFASVPRVLRQLCGDDRCVRETARLARGRNGLPVFSALFAGDENIALRAFYPAAVRAALAGDTRPIVRLLRLADERFPARVLNPSVNTATVCTDTVEPWRRGASVHSRRVALRRALRRVPASVFTRSTIRATSSAQMCLRWPATGLPGAVTRRPAPAVPALVLVGEQDLRTSLADAREVVGAFPRSQLLAVPFRGHGVLRNDVACGQLALLAFVADQPVGNPCAGATPVLALQPVPPRRLSDVAPDPAVADPGLARVLAAVRLTLDDARAVARVRARATGLRGGRQRLAGETLVLDELAFVPGVALSGSVGPAGGTVTVRAAQGSGALQVAADGTLKGRLGAQTIG